MMLGRSNPVVPVADNFTASFTPAGPPSDDDAPKESRLDRRSRSTTRHETAINFRSARRWVTITFGERAAAEAAANEAEDALDKRDDDFRTLFCPEARQVQEAVRERAADLFVKRVYCFYSTFAHSSGLDQNMEYKFGQLQYWNFRTAFMHASIFMMLGTLGLAAMEFSLGHCHYIRTVILTAGVAPLYMCFGIFAFRWTDAFVGMSGTWGEKIFIGLMCLQMLMIVGAEWSRPDFDYGLLVLHIGFVHNFTPLGAQSMQTVTAACGLLPYVVLTVFGLQGWEFRDLFPAADVCPVHEDSPGSKCTERMGIEAKQVKIVVPIVIFIYQVVVTMRRDESLRLDFLCRINLVMQQMVLDYEKVRNEGLLMSMLPRKVIEALQNNEPVEPQLFEHVTVVFIEICHFGHLCARLEPAEVVEVLNVVYLEFDRLSDMLDVYKVETVGQVYMAVVGCPESIANHADVAAHFALATQRSMLHIKGIIAGKIGALARDSSNSTFNQSRSMSHMSALGADAVQALSPPGIQEPAEAPESEALPQIAPAVDLDVVIHVGLNSGPIRAGLVGIDSPRYKLFGDTVNTASRMESTCEPGRVQLSDTTVHRLSRGMFTLEDRGEISVKGKGTMRTAYLTGYARPGDEDARRVLIEHDLSARAPHAGEDSTSSPAEEARPRGAALRGCSGLGTMEDTVLRICSASSPRSHWLSDVAKSTSPTSALVSAALGQSHPTPEDVERQESSASQASNSARGLMGVIRKFVVGLQLMYLLVPAEQKHRARLAELRRDLPGYTEAMRPHRIVMARILTVVWLMLMAGIAGIDFFLDVLEEDLRSYRAAVFARLVGSTLSGLVYLLLLPVPAVGNVAQQATVVMLLLQGVALLACGGLLYNGEPGIIALYGAFILFYTICSLTQRLLLCMSAVVGYVVIEYGRCGLPGVRIAADNISFLVAFIIAMACSVTLQEYLQHVSCFEQRYKERRLEDITMAQRAGSQLLTALLPAHVVTQVGEMITSPIAEHHQDVTILFTDIKGFTAYSSRIPVQKLVAVLNSMYSVFDEIIANWGLHKVEIIGDAYFVSAGCPRSEADPSENAMRAVEVGLAMLRSLPSVCDDTTVQMRAGLHTGSVVAGVVGKKGPRYHLFGSTVAYAEKMESHGIPGKVQLSEATHALLVHSSHAYDFEERSIQVEGEEGLQKTWVVNRSNCKVAFQIQKKLMSQRRNNQQRPSGSGSNNGTARNTPSTTATSERVRPSWTKRCSAEALPKSAAPSPSTASSMHSEEAISWLL